jgi:hypothetical protein
MMTWAIWGIIQSEPLNIITSNNFIIQCIKKSFRQICEVLRCMKQIVCIYFYEISRSHSLFKNRTWFFNYHKSCRADQYESNDHKLGTIPTNRSCDIATGSTRASCAARLILIRRSSRRSGSLFCSEWRYHTNGSSEWYPIYCHWNCIYLLYNFHGSGKIKFYLKKWCWPWYFIKTKDTNMFRTLCLPLETAHIFPEAFRDAVYNEGIIPGDNVQLYVEELHDSFRSHSIVRASVAKFRRPSRVARRVLKKGIQKQ